MKRILPGTKGPRIPGLELRLSEHLPDERRPKLADILTRNEYAQSTLSSDHTDLTVGNTQTQTTDDLQRVRSVQVGSVSGGTVTIQMQVEGRDIFDDAARPVSGGEVQRPTEVYTFPAGSVVDTIVEASSGVPTGTANVVIETEPYVLGPRFEERVLRGKDRLLGSKRREAERYNNSGGRVPLPAAEARRSGPTPQKITTQDEPTPLPQHIRVPRKKPPPPPGKF